MMRYGLLSAISFLFFIALASVRPALADEASPDRYTTRADHDPDGIGKFYMGREIAHVMGHQGIAWLERPVREEEERLTKLIAALDLKPGMTVADIGAGSGVVSVMMARKVGPKGKVLAVDIQQEMLDALVERCRLLNVTNIEPVRGTEKSPQLDPGSVDLVVMVDVYHEFNFPYEMLSEIAASLKPSGRIAFVEYRKEDPTVPIKEVHKMYEMQVRREAGLPEFGLVWVKTDQSLPRQNVTFMQKPDPSVNGPILVGAEWPQFRGSRSDNHADGANLPISWSETQNIFWKCDIPGRGWSSPVVCGPQVWMTTATEEGHSLRAICVDLWNGKVARDIEVFRPEKLVNVNGHNSYASPTPCIELGRVYVHFGSMGTAAIDTDTGEIVWKNETLVIDHMEGPGGSPILVGDKLVLTCDGTDQQYVAVLDKATGDLVSKLPRLQPLPESTDMKKAFATPLAVRIDGQELLVCPGATQVEVHGPGGPLWNVRYGGFSNVPQPLYSSDLNMFFVCTGYMKPELWAIRAGGQGDVSESHVAWKFKRQVPAIPTPVLVGERVFMVHESGVMTCVNAKTGEQVWQQRLEGHFDASPLASDGKIYLFSDEGKGYVVEAKDEFKVLKESTLPGQIFASPAVVGNGLLVRTDAQLFAISKKRR